MESKSFVCGSVAMQFFQHLWKLTFVKPDWLGGFRCPANVTGFGIMKYVLCSHWYMIIDIYGHMQIHFHPWNGYYGFSPLESIGQQVATNHELTRFQAGLWTSAIAAFEMVSAWDGGTSSYNARGKCEHSHRFPNLKLNDISIAERKILITIYSLHLDTVLVCTSDRYPLNRGLVVAKCNNYF